MTTEKAKVGTKVLKSGFEGVIVFVHEGQLEGMVDVRLSSGIGCVPIYELQEKE